MRARAALLVVACLGLGAGAVVAGEAGPPRARVELRGPLSDVTLDFGAAGATRLRGELLPGETRELEVPLPIDAALLAPRVSVASGDPAGVRVEPAPRMGSTFDASLRARPRPPVGARAQRPALASLMIVAAGLLVAALARERPRVVVGASLAAALGVVLLPPLRDAGAASVRVYEADGGTGRWLAVQAAADAVELDPARPFVLEVEPPGARIEWSVELSAATPTWRASSPGSRLTLLASFDPAERRLERDLNAWASLPRVWARSRESGWRPLGPWGLGQGLPGAGAGAGTGGGTPPGWLVAALPPGREALVARIETGRAPAVGGWSAPDQAWLRRIGPGLELGESFRASPLGDRALAPGDSPSPADSSEPVDSPGNGD